MSQPSLRTLLLCVLAAALGGLGAWLALRPSAPTYPGAPAVVARVREVAKLEAVEATLYRKVSFAPDPVPASDLWGDVWTWASHTLRQPKGRAIVFARAHLSYDLAKLETDAVRSDAGAAEVRLPPLEVVVELLPGETEVIASNLSSAETAQLLELARVAIEREVRADSALRQRAEASARETLRALLFEMGFRSVRVATSSSSS